MSKQIKVVTEAEYGDGPVYVNDESVGQAGYFGSIQEMREAYEDRQQPLPGKVSGCYTVLFSLPRATEIINDALSNGEWHDGCDPDADDAALQAAIDAYNARQTECTWFVDDDVEVVLKASYAFPDDTSLASMTEEEKGAELRKAVASGWSEAEAQGTIWPSGTPDRCTETYPEYGQCRYHNGHAGPHRATRWDGGKTWSSASPPSPTTAPNACTDRHTARDVSEMPAPATPAPRCKCGDPACPLWSEDIVCPHCSAALEAITADPEFEGRGGDMGEGHYADCPHGLAAMAGDILTGSLKIEDALVILARPAAPQGGEPGESRHLRALAEVTEQLAVSEKLNAGVVFLSLAVTPADARAIRSALASPPAGAPYNYETLASDWDRGAPETAPLTDDVLAQDLTESAVYWESIGAGQPRGSYKDWLLERASRLRALAGRPAEAPGGANSFVTEGEVEAYLASRPHPEDFCQRCGGPNISWFAPNDLWNRVMPDDGIVCPGCFARAAEAIGICPSAWCLTPEKP